MCYDIELRLREKQEIENMHTTFEYFQNKTTCAEFERASLHIFYFVINLIRLTN